MTHHMRMKTIMTLPLFLALSTASFARVISMAELSYMLERGSSQETINWIIDDCQSDPECSFGPIKNPDSNTDEALAHAAQSHHDRFNQAVAAKATPRGVPRSQAAPIRKRPSQLRRSSTEPRR